MNRRIITDISTVSMEDALTKASSYSSSPEYFEQLRKIKGILDFEASYTYGFRPSPEQYRSIITPADRVLVDACPGSGKTASMIFRILCDGAVNNLEMGQQLVITYTKKAAEEMNVRYQKLCRQHNVSSIASMSTFHAFAYNVETKLMPLKVITGSGIEVEVSKKVAKRQETEEDRRKKEALARIMGGLVLEDEESEQKETKFITESGIYQEVVDELGLSRNYYKYLRDLPGWINMIIESGIETQEDLLQLEEFVELDFVTIEDLREINRLAMIKRRELGIMNFTDMLVSFHDRLQSLDTLESARDLKPLLAYKFIYVDEFQDISSLQWDIIKELLRLNPDAKLYCVGDADQSIFAFRGADPSFITDFEKLIEEAEDDTTIDIISYTINRRSGKKIVSLGQTLISKNVHRYPKEMQPYKDVIGNIDLRYVINTPKHFCEDEILKEVKQKYLENGIGGIKDIAILYREHKQAAKLMRSMIREEIPIVIKDFNLGINSRESYDVTGILDLIYNPKDPNLIRKYLYKCVPAVTKAIGSNIADSAMVNNRPFSTFINHNVLKHNELNKLRYAYLSIQQGNTMTALKLIKDAYFKSYLKLFPERVWGLEDAIDALSDYEGMDYYKFTEAVTADRNVLSAVSRNNVGVNFLTFHTSKGLEFKDVKILPISDAVTPKKAVLKKMSERNAAKYIEEERRLLFVAATRAEEKLTIYCGDNSMFVEELKLAENISDKKFSEIKTATEQELETLENSFEWGLNSVEKFEIDF